MHTEGMLERALAAKAARRALARSVPEGDELISFVMPSRELDPDGSKLRRLLHVHVACGEIRAARQWLLRGVLALNVPVWLSAFRPASLPDRIRGLALATWAAGSVVLFLVVVVERWCRRLRGRHLEDLTGSHGSADAGGRFHPAAGADTDAAYVSSLQPSRGAPR